jgi:glycosyltransferase involved in cell wall biosynthesis
VLVDRAGAERAARRSFAAASALLAVSQPVADWLCARGVPAGRVHVVPNGVDPDRFAPPPPRPRDAPFTVGFVGTLKPWHGLDALVEAFELLRRQQPGARLLVVGDGPGRPGLEAALVARGLSERSRITGAVNPAAVPPLLREMDAAVAPYPDLRPFYFSPLKVVEYMAAGLPVVASRVGQVAQTVEHGVTGLLVPPGDPGALAAALTRLAGDPGLSCRLGRAARERAARQYSWDRVADRILALARERRAVAA